MNYGDLPGEYSGSDGGIVFLPVPFDATSTWIKGADKGPEAIISASANMELYDIETDSEVYTEGIYTAEPVVERGSAEQMVEKVRKAAGGYLDKGKFVVTVGGEHSVSIGAIAAHSEKFENITILQLDAHCDLRGEYEGSRFNHGCVMARAREFGSVVQVGVRSMSAQEKAAVEPGRVFFARDIHKSSNWVDKVISKLTEKVYITIDLDVFDTGIMPATGTPEPGGLGWYEITGLLRKVCMKRELVGFDVVELCPNEHSQGSDFLAAKLIYKLLSYKFKG